MTIGLQFSGKQFSRIAVLTIPVCVSAGYQGVATQVQSLLGQVVALRLFANTAAQDGERRLLIILRE